MDAMTTRGHFKVVCDVCATFDPTHTWGCSARGHVVLCDDCATAWDFTVTAFPTLRDTATPRQIVVFLQGAQFQRLILDIRDRANAQEAT